MKCCGQEPIKNMALGKEFYVCTECKQEVVEAVEADEIYVSLCGISNVLMDYYSPKEDDSVNGDATDYNVSPFRASWEAVIQEAYERIIKKQSAQHKASFAAHLALLDQIQLLNTEEGENNE